MNLSDVARWDDTSDKSTGASSRAGSPFDATPRQRGPRGGGEADVGHTDIAHTTGHATSGRVTSPWVRVFVVSVVEGDRAVVELQGEIDIANAGYVRAELAYLIDSGRTDIVVDLTMVVSISSSGLGVLVATVKTVTAVGGRLQLVVPGEHLRRILRITRLTQVFTVHRTLGAALAH